jgi:ATP-dependent helicase/nuclease subunit A
VPPRLLGALVSGNAAGHASEDREADFLRHALDPANSVVIDACAGSGKTWLLVARIIRLLLAGAAPSEILAITFTRKGAQEMQARLTDSLRTLATADDAGLAAFLHARGIHGKPGIELIERARGLFEICLNARPGITIDTFHGWFLQLLERAPLDAAAGGVPGDFSLEEKTSFLLDEAWDLFGAQLSLSENQALAAHFRELAAALGYANLRKLAGRFLQKRAEWWAYTRGQADPVDFALGELRELLGVDPLADPAAFVVADTEFLASVASLAQVDAGSSKTQQNFARELAAAGEIADPRARLKALYASCHTGDGTPRSLLVKFFGRQSPALDAVFTAFCARLQNAHDMLAEIDVYRLHQSLLPCAARLLEVFQQLKHARQVIDFTDIEWQAYRLLADNEDAAFMHAKLDARYRHILLDEFQDTNPLQWQALRVWLDAYGADAGRPAVFLVGDPKQAIYRFRRAEPRLFGIAAEVLARDYGAATLRTSTTRRCAPAIVDTVNAVFCGADDYPDFPLHVAHAATVAGRVEVLPLVREAPKDAAAEADATAWRNPLHEPLREHDDLRRNAEAAQLASRIREMVGNWEVAGEGGRSRPARYADVMILKRSRTHLPAYEHALRVAGIPFLTARHGGLLETLEAADLCALIEVLISPFDDLRLAHALRSPVFGCGDQDLIRLAQCAAAEGGEPPSWWQRLEILTAGPGASPALQRARRLLASWRDAADTEPVHDLLDRIYHEGELVRRYRAACPPALAGQVTANLNRFIELALELDSGRYPSLPRFVAELGRLRAAPEQEAPDEGREQGADEAAEDLREGLDAVRIHTIHGAKGLEAPIVWLIDANEGSRAESYDVLVDWPPEAAAPLHFSLFTIKSARGQRRAPVFEAQARLAAQERLNLLYVALTRAQRYLFVSGIGSEHGGASQDHRAYDRVATAVSRLAGADDALVVGAIPEPQEVAVPQIAIGKPAQVAASPLRSGSSHGERLDDNPAARAGVVLHRILEHIGEDPATGAVVGHDLRRSTGLTQAEFDPLWEQARAMVEAPHLQRFFLPGGFVRAENELEVLAGDELRRIDRVVEFADEVWILDYKSGRSIEMAAWRGQLAAYSALLKPLFAGKNLHAAVILGDGSLHEM